MTRARGMALGALMALTTGCMTYRGPYGVEAVLERKLGVELHRELGIKLGPISIKFARRSSGTIHDMIVLAVDGDEVVLARLTGRLDGLIANAMDGAKNDGAQGRPRGGRFRQRLARSCRVATRLP